jgi:stage IV sporulation protein A
LRASAPSLHLIKANIETEVSPIVGTEKQGEDLVKSLMEQYESDPEKLWQANMFGKSLEDLVKEGMQNKLFRMPEDVQEKLQRTLQRIINEGNGGLICIIL